jgi:hypothetical protein
MTAARSRVLLTVVGSGLLAVSLVGCGSGTHQASPAPVVASPSAATASPVTPLATSAPVLSAQDVADPGLPSKVGAGKLSTPTIKRLMQFFEDKVSQAYATGHADVLDHYLAGPMLNGNRATISLLSSQHKRNVFKIRVESVKPQADQAHRVVFDMTGDMTLNYFFDPGTKKILDNGLPGPSQVQFLVFLDQNPKTGTWYWTGEQSDANQSGSTG